ncbi:organic cation transporter protein-like [Dendronephthya gigantea]|uniref:organic cation transporter protein-like n=1 Tax=Dendronephthya gigantea TaxID=151771 RepID=UPI00106C0895|nr:organic cation transporter protein-like [Dendronephthya gigantea]
MATNIDLFHDKLFCFKKGSMLVSFTLALELFQTKYRARAGVFFGIMAVIGGVVLGILAYLIRDWRYIQLALSFIPFILLLLCVSLNQCLPVFVPESLRWLILHKKYDKAERVVRRIVMFNRLRCPEEILAEIKESRVLQDNRAKRIRRPSVIELFRSRSLRKRSLTLILLWFTVSSAFYGLAFNISALFGDKYINFGISEAVDLCAILVILWAVPKFGHRKPLVIEFFICGIANFISLATIAMKSDSTSLKILETACALIGKSSALAALNTIGTFTAELYPTVIRNISLGVNSAWSRIGGMLSPQIFLLGAYTAKFVPYAIFGVLSLTSAFLILLLPETHNTSLMDTVDDVRRQKLVIETNLDEEDDHERSKNVEGSSLIR